MPAGLADWIAWNPIAHVIETMRDGFYGPDPDGFASAPFVLAVAASLFLAGAILIRGQQGKMLQI